MKLPPGWEFAKIKAGLRAKKRIAAVAISLRSEDEEISECTSVFK